MKNKRGFTLIEIMAALLIFAIGGTVSLSVFNFNTTQRIELNARSEAMLLANNLLQSEILYHQCHSPKAISTGSTFKYPNDSRVPADIQNNHVFPGTLWDWKDVPLQTHTGTFPSVTQHGGSTNLRNPNSSSLPMYEWGLSLSSPNNTFEIKRTHLNGETLSTATTDVMNSFSSDARLILVTVTWPKSNDPTDRAIRNRVTVSAIVP